MQDKTQIKEYIIKIYNAPAEVLPRPDIPASLRKIKRFCRAALRDDALGTAAGAKWVSDNYYVIEREAKALINAGNREFPGNSRLYDYVEKLFFFTEYELTGDVASSFFEVFSRNDFLSDREICSVQNVMKAVIIDRIAELCTQLKEKTGFDMASVEKALAVEKTARNLITSLRKSSIIDFASYVAGYSPLERMLRLDPAGIYPHMDKATQLMYRRNLEKLARKSRQSQTDFIKDIVNKCSAPEAQHRHIGFYLVKKHSAVGYVCLLSVIFALLYSGAVWLCSKSGYFTAVFALLLPVPMFESARMLADRLWAAGRRPDIIPKMKFDTPSGIPDDCRTLTVITSLLFGGSEDEKLFCRLERFYLANRDKNLCFGVLGDLPEHTEAHGDKDDAVIEAAARQVEKLNLKYGGGFYLFTRKRVFCKTQNRYMGYERKRGAVIELSRLLRGGSTTIDRVYGDQKGLENIKYLLTLDADTDVGLGQIAQLCGAMAHPLNRPVLAQKDGRYYVQSGYGIMQPVMSYALEAAGKTPFCVLKSGAGGKEVYAGAAFDIYQSVFCSGMFCGKGIFDIDAFLKVIDGAFPDGRILSHDILEGCLLHCGLLSDVVLTDSLPQNPISYFRREHRWARGDVQAMAFAGRRVRNAQGKYSLNPLDTLSKFKLISNISRMLLPVCAVAVMIASLLSGRQNLAFLGLLYIFVPFICDALRIVFSRRFQPVFRKFAGDVLSGIWYVFLNLMYDVSTLFHRAYINADAILRSLWRMKVSGKNLLEWTTASEADRRKSGGISAYFSYMKLSVAVGVAFCIFGGGGLLRFCGVAFGLCPIVCFMLSRPRSEKPAATPEQKEILSGYCRDMWKFFSEQVSSAQNWLPPDNLQLAPVRSRADRCSPTNIGLYLLSVLAARDFGFIQDNELYERIKNTLDTVEKLEKWHGHLLNWYDNRTLETVGLKYVSTVDSGNFVTCLTALAQGLAEYESRDGRTESLIKRINALADGADFRVLYNSGRDLFYLGYNLQTGTLGEGCYDLFMSEARTTGYFAIAKGDVPKRHWAAIARILISRGFYIGAASWTGTTFEYFMPTLLLPVYRNSFSHEALEFAFSEQKRHGASVAGVRVWGSSECGFYDFDAQMNYQYKAIGAPFLSLKHEDNQELVISPYSSFLMLERSCSQVLKNLENLRKLGMYSKYGFYEAVDFTPSRTEGDYARVESYMAHHVGMSIIACANSVYGNLFQKRFMSDPRMACAVELLEEKIPTDAHIFNDVDKGDIPERRTKSPYGIKSDSICASKPRIALFSGHRSILRVSDCAQVWFERREDRRSLCVNNPPMTLCDLRPGFVAAASINGHIYSPDRQLCDGQAKINFEYNRDFAGFNVTGDGRLVNVAFRLSAQYCALYTDITVSCREGDKTDFMLYFEPVLKSREDYQAHPAFCALSTEAEYDAQNGILLFRRRSRKAGGDVYMAVGPAESGADIEFESRADTLYADCDDLGLIMRQNKPLSCKTGACVSPRVFMRVHGKNRRRSTRRMCFITLCASGREKALSLFLRARESFDSQREIDALASANTRKAIETSTDSLDMSDYLLLEKLLRGVSFAQNGALRDDITETGFCREDLWRYSVSGDLPVVSVRVNGEQQLKFCGRMIMLHRLCAIKGVEFDLVFLTQDTEQYDRPIYTGLRALTARYRSDYLVGRRGGLFFVGEGDATEVFKACSSLWFDGQDTPEKEALPVRLPEIKTRPDKNWYGSPYEPVLETCGGDFINHGFVIDKIDRRPQVNYCHLLSNRLFGTVITQNSLGYTWFSNSHERRLSLFENSPYDSFFSETLYMCGDYGVYDLCRMSARVEYTPNQATFYGRAENTDYKIEVFVNARQFIKQLRVSLSQPKKVFYALRPVLGSRPGNIGMYYVKYRNSLLYASPFCRDMGLLTMPNRQKGRVCTSLFEMFSGRDELHDLAAVGDEDTNLEFALCRVNGKATAEQALKYLSGRTFDAMAQESREFADKMLGDMLKNSLPGQDGVKVITDFWIPYQAIFCRFFARGALYQSGGAYGFRDQLQDTRLFLESNPVYAKRHIIRCASHQFEEGDVQHWWHNVLSRDGFNPGIRSRCSDDYLWLVLCTGEYVRATGDNSLLDVKTRYISDRPLAQNEVERYSVPGFSNTKESIYQHCKRAVTLFMRRGLGEHGLPFIGSCDWNDGLSAVGEAGKGESVWLAMFGRIVLEKFAALAKIMGENPQEYYDFSDELGENIEKNAYNGKWYLRGFYDDGSPLGDESCDECKIDLLPQAFAAICDRLLQNTRPDAVRSQKSRIESGLDHAYNLLFDKELRILKLFWPAFDKTAQNPGYIKSYAPGLRENGGQYTHAAVWGALGFMCAGQQQRAQEIIRALCPAVRAQDSRLFERYKTEPYVLCGDVYSNPHHPGRGGWSWYTGSAAWYYELASGDRQNGLTMVP